MKKLLVGMLLLLLFCAGGCIIVSKNKCGQPAAPLQREAYRVGGGFQIKYTAPEDGTAVLVDKKSGKTVQTESLKAGQDFTFHPSTEDCEVQLAKMGIDLKKADFVLYFHPKNPKPLPPMPPRQPKMQPPCGHPVPPMSMPPLPSPPPGAPEM